MMRGDLPLPPPPPVRVRCNTSEELERAFPHTTAIIHRGGWTSLELAELSGWMKPFGDVRSGEFNGIRHFYFTCPEQAAKLREHALETRLHRLKAHCTRGATREEVALEWERMAAEREEILAWGRLTGMTRQVVAHYRAERHVGTYSYTAHFNAAKIIEKAHPTISDPRNHAGVMIEWAEREHRAWFWRCCRGLHHL
ncbi:hypothetical protein [Reyranella sp.]|uniref:hypothetical protein n=1 Tax=Reyranella sp. TaxID=1929291 RepID=UPI004035A455